MAEEELFTTLSETLLGTDFTIRFAIQDDGLEVEEFEAEELLNRNGVSSCAMCGTWNDVPGDFCEERD